MQKTLFSFSFFLFSTGINAQKDTSHSVIEEEPTITVTSYLSNVKAKQFPQSINVVTKNILFNTSTTNIIESLSKTVPGFNAVTSGPAVAKPFIRGLGYNRVLTINDGIRQEGQQWGDEHGIEIDDYNIQKAEVLKGPASMMYGSDALAGVVNFESQKEAPEGTIRANILSEYQTNNMLRGFYANIGGTERDLIFNVYSSYKGAADYKNRYDGRVFNSKFYNISAGGMMGYRWKKGVSKLLVSHFQQNIGMVEGERNESGAFIKEEHNNHIQLAEDADFKRITPFEPYQKVNHFKITSSNSFDIAAAKLDILLAWQKNNRQEFGHVHNDELPSEESHNGPVAHFDLQTINYNVFYKLPAFDFWKITLGINGMQQNNKNLAAEKIIPDYSLFDIGVFSYMQYIKNNFTVAGGVRYDLRSIQSRNTMDDEKNLKFEAFDKSFNNISGSIGATFEANDIVSLKVNVAKGFRAPNLAELASNGAHEGTFRYEIGNKYLISEKSLQFDAGINISTNHFTFNAGVYYNTIKDFIFYEKIKSIYGGDSLIVDRESTRTIPVFKFNQHDVHMYGTEVSMDIHPHPLDWLHFENIISYVRAKFTNAIDNSVNVPYIPAARWISQIKTYVPVKERSFISNLQIGIESDYNFAQNKAFTGYDTETNTAAYWLINSFVSFDIYRKESTLLTISLTANNLLDIAYQNHLSRLKYAPINETTNRTGVFEMGRNIGIKINIPLAIKER